MADYRHKITHFQVDYYLLDNIMPYIWNERCLLLRLVFTACGQMKSNISQRNIFKFVILTHLGGYNLTVLSIHPSVSSFVLSVHSSNQQQEFDEI